MHKKHHKKFTLRDYVVAGFLGVLLVWLIFLNVSIGKKEEIARKAARDTQAQLASLHSREVTLQNSINELSTPRGQEETVRETFGVAKPGEGEIVVLPPKIASTTPPQTFWQKWFGWVKFW